MSKNSKNFLTGKFIKRYKRFFVDVQLDSKKIVTAHCPNTGSMMGLLEKDNLVYLTEADDPNRKLKFTLEAIQSNGAMVGVNTHRANRIVEEAISNGKISELGNIVSFKREVKYGQNSRIDFLVQKKNEGSIKGSGTDRKAILKRAFRAGEKQDQARGSKPAIRAPKGMKGRTSRGSMDAFSAKHKDKGIEKAYKAGFHGDYSGNAPDKGKERMKPQSNFPLNKDQMKARKMMRGK